MVRNVICSANILTCKRNCDAVMKMGIRTNILFLMLAPSLIIALVLFVYLTHSQREASGFSLLLTLSCLLLAVLLGYRISRRISDPILRMENAVRELRDGRLDPPQEYSSGTLSSLEQHLNAMVSTLKISHEHLQDQVDEATAELRETMEELEIKNAELDIARKKAIQASRVKSEFLANMSHEIRTPMNGVMGYIALLSKTELNRTQQGYLQTLRASAENLMVILNDTLDFSKIEAGKFTVRKRNFDLREVLENAVLLFAANAHYKGLNLILDIEPDVPSHLVGDAPRIVQIVTNLVSNAIKSTDQGAIEVRVCKTKETARSLNLGLEVHDTGIGIAPEDQKRLFKAFDQLDTSTTRRHGGTGLGLAITQRLISMMNGHIRVKSQPGVGTVFYVSLVLDKQDRAVEEHQLLNLPILLISDDTALARAISHILEFGGAQPYRVADLTAAADWLKGSPDDVDALRGIVLDHDDSQIIAPTFLKTVQERELGQHCVLILMGASEDHPGMRCFKEIFRTVYFANKPPTARELLNFLSTRPQPPNSRFTSVDHYYDQEKELPVPTAPSHIRVLLADDNLINRRLARTFLNQLGILVDEASNGLEAVEACRHKNYDLIFMDIHMPEMDGLEATQRIRTLEDNPNSHVPIVALTADAMNQERAQYIKAGMNDHVSKPITETALKQMLEKWCLISSSALKLASSR